mmetsp:Transcript_10139/g.33264  ORF Transcript_10139/g.33264 Transcript_10139/m.33264 type:complete len:107 (+) Transcript_10139:646-966(+)
MHGLLHPMAPCTARWLPPRLEGLMSCWRLDGSMMAPQAPSEGDRRTDPNLEREEYNTRMGITFLKGDFQAASNSSLSTVANALSLSSTSGVSPTCLDTLARQESSS